MQHKRYPSSRQRWDAPGGVAVFISSLRLSVYISFHPLPSLPSRDDKTRVAIGDNQDYINASYIRMRVGEEEFFYISCQGPLPTTVAAFWQMIWESKSDVVAMMTKEVERGRVKCHRYWPEKPGIPQDTGRYLLHLENQQNLEYFQIKIIRMVEREVRTQSLIQGEPLFNLSRFQNLTRDPCQPLTENILNEGSHCELSCSYKD